MNRPFSLSERIAVSIMVLLGIICFAHFVEQTPVPQTPSVNNADAAQLERSWYGAPIPASIPDDERRRWSARLHLIRTKVDQVALRHDALPDDLRTRVLEARGRILGASSPKNAWEWGLVRQAAQALGTSIPLNAIGLNDRKRGIVVMYIDTNILALVVDTDQVRRKNDDELVEILVHELTHVAEKWRTMDALGVTYGELNALGVFCSDKPFQQIFATEAVAIFNQATWALEHPRNGINIRETTDEETLPLRLALASYAGEPTAAEAFSEFLSRYAFFLITQASSFYLDPRVARERCGPLQTPAGNSWISADLFPTYLLPLVNAQPHQWWIQ